MRELISFPDDPAQARSAEFKVGIRSLPYLADHGFQGMVVLPGSFYIEMALLVHREILKETPGILRNVKFRSPVILSDEDTVIKVKVGKNGGKRVEYTFFGSGPDENYTPHFAGVEIDSTRIATPGKPAHEFSIAEFKTRAGPAITAEEFYGRLKASGNQYGPRFQNLSAVWKSGDQALGKLTVPGNQPHARQHYLHPTLVDSITQLLAVFTMEKGRTFILESIEKIEIRDSNFPETLWARATRCSGHDEATGFVGDIDVFDEAGKHYFELTGVAFTYLDRLESAGVDKGNQLDLCVASTFTAEPLEDSLKFWGDRFGVPTEILFAPNNQIFQQLLDTGSAFHKNSDGVNAIVLGLEDWTEKDQQAGLKVDLERLERCFANRSRYVLPNGLEIVHLNQYETDYVYQEIFHDQCYLRHGIRLHDGDTVVDIGANIGLFSLFVMSRCQNPEIYAFEPSPVVFKLLKANCEAYGGKVHAFHCGVSDKPGTAEFTFYEKSSVFSSFHPNASADKEAIEAVVRNMLSCETPAGDESLEESVRELTAERLDRETYQCPLTSVSEIIRKNRLKKIHLLKIDAEKSELDIINGIDDSHWPMIDQIVIEVHDRTKHTGDLIERLLTEKGYRCALEEEKMLGGSGLFQLYATRIEETKTPATAASPVRKVDRSLERNIDEFCAALHSFMTQSTAPMLLCVCPRSPDAMNRVEFNETLEAAEHALLARTSKIANVHSIDSASILTRYPLRDYYDPHSHQLGHVPYTPEGYAAIGTMLFQTLFKLESKPLKVIVLDCDNTLWQGVCGEDGPDGIQITEAHRLLQEFVIEQMKSGLLICLCSKNNEKDVLDVFDQRKDMVLKREHLVSCRINWEPKSDNIRSIAAELNVDLDSFLFVDDNPVECAEVRIKCPEVLTLQLPRKREAIPSFLRNIWTSGDALLTREDQTRTQRYQENVQREQFREQTVSLKDFLKGLQLHIKLAAPNENQIGRVSQLTLRTNQFNFSTIRRSENEVRNWLEEENHECLVASVRDRFGDYGLVGLLLYETALDQFTVDTFLLSCRVLGRGVEHYLLAELGRKAEKDGKQFVQLRYLPTEKNAPALDFISSLGANLAKDEAGALTTRIASATLAALQYEPDKRSQPKSDDAKKVRQRPAGQPTKWFGSSSRSETLQLIAGELYDINRIAKAIEDHRYRGKPAGGFVEAEPGDTLEAVLSNLWKKVLGRRQIGINENFFEAGGTSLKAVRVIALIQKELKRRLSITSLFESPTIKLLAAALQRASDSGGKGADITKAHMRGRQRRHIKRTKKKSA